MSFVVLAVADGGPSTERVIETALDLRSIAGAHVRALHVRDTSGAVPADQVEPRARRAASAWAGFERSSGDSEFVERRGPETDLVLSTGRLSDCVVVARPGGDEQRSEPAHVEALVFRSGRPILVVPPATSRTWTERALIIWNDTEQAVRAVAGALPLLKLARSVTVASVVPAGQAVQTDGIVDYLARHGIVASTARIEPEGSSARARGRAVVFYAFMTQAGFTVMGAYGEPGLRGFMGLGGATAKVITGTRTPLLLAH
jgi:nucleotide-binding universal stress UspA family protein